MENLKVNDWVRYQGKKRQVAIVNGDGTIRLKSDDPTERSYGNGTIGCFHKNWLSPLIENQTVVEWLIESVETFVNIHGYDFHPKIYDLFEQAKAKEKEQMIDFADDYGTYLLKGGQMCASTYQETLKSE
jgi:hypothetical protein